jgi:hypothetical protein
MNTNIPNKFNSIVNKIYEETSKLGKYKFRTAIISGVILTIIILICGIVNIFTWDDKLIDTTASIIESNCTSDTVTDDKGKVTTTYKCNINVQVIDNGITINKMLVTNSSKKYIVGDTIPVTIDKRDTNNIGVVLSIYRMSNTWIFIIGVILAVLTLITYLIYSSKYAKIIESGYGTYSLVRTVL